MSAQCQHCINQIAIVRSVEQRTYICKDCILKANTCRHSVQGKLVYYCANDRLFHVGLVVAGVAIEFSEEECTVVRKLTDTKVFIVTFLKFSVHTITEAKQYAELGRAEPGLQPGRWIFQPGHLTWRALV